MSPEGQSFLTKHLGYLPELIRSQLPKSPLALRELARAVLLCWQPLALALVAPLALTMTGQGRQALLIASSDFGSGPLALFCLWPVVVAIYSSLLLDTLHPDNAPAGAVPYARATAPLIVSTLVVFALPLLLQHLADGALPFRGSPDWSVGSNDPIVKLTWFLQIVGPMAMFIFFQSRVAVARAAANSVYGEVAVLVFVGLFICISIKYGIGYGLPDPEAAQDPYFQETVTRQIFVFIVACMFVVNRGNAGSNPLPSTTFLALNTCIVAYAIIFIVTDSRMILTRMIFLVVFVAAGNWLLIDWPKLGNQDPGPNVRRSNALFMGSLAFVSVTYVFTATGLMASDPVDKASRWQLSAIVFFAPLAWLCVGLCLEALFWLIAKPFAPKRRRGIIILARVATFGVIAWRLVTGPFNEAKLRALSVTSDGHSPTSFDAYVDRWLNQRRERAKASGGFPIFIVIAEGGGIRAAYWTSTVLGALQDEHADFAEHVLALSGVSGGSIGIGVFSALVQSTAARHCAHGKVPETEDIGYARCASAIASTDLLAPVLASTFFGEPAHRLLGFGSADRAAELEGSLERGWRRSIEDNSLGKPFSMLGTGSMLLLPNATTIKGRRVIVSGLAWGEGSTAAQILDAGAFRTSTAIFLSARFPIISPVAKYRVITGEPPQNGATTWRIVDGGYFDNSGAATGLDILRGLERSLKRLDLADVFFPVIIAITNSEPATTENEAPPDWQRQLLGALLGPAEVVGAVWDQNQRAHPVELCKDVRASGGEFLAGLRLPRLEQDKVEFPLGWTLAPATAAEISNRLNALRKEDAGDFDRIAALLAGKKNRGGIDCSALELNP